MTTSSTPVAPTGQLLFASSVVALVLLGAAGLGLLQAVSDGTGGEVFWTIVGVAAITLALGVLVVGVSNLVRSRLAVVSTAAVLVVTLPLVLVAVMAGPAVGRAFGS